MTENKNQMPLGIAPYIHLHRKKTDQFKTNFLGFHFRRPLTPYEATCSTLLTAVMTKCSKAYQSPTAFSKAMDSLYGCAVYSDVEKFGEMLSVQFKVVFAKDAHLPEPIMTDVLDFVQDMLFDPAIFADTFDPVIFETEKKALMDEYASRKNDRVGYSYDRLIEEMCSDEAYRHYKYGAPEVLDKLTLSDLKTYYAELFSSSEVDIIAVGDFEAPTFVERLKAYPFQVTKPIAVDFGNVAVNPKERRYVNERDDLQQGKLNIGYRLPIDTAGEAYYAAVVMSFLLGNGVNSYLFRVMREKENLCYYAFSRFEGFKGLLVVGSGIESANTQKALAIVEEAIEWIKSQAFSVEDLALAQKAIVKSLESTQDSLMSTAGFIYSQLLRGNDRGVEGYVQQVKAIKAELVVEVANQLLPDTIYMLSGEEVTL